MKSLYFFTAIAYLSTAIALQAQSAQDLATKLAPLYESKSLRFEELAQNQDEMIDMFNHLIKEFSAKQDALHEKASDYMAMHNSYDRLFKEMQSVKSWKDLGEAFSNSLSRLPKKAHEDQFAALADEFAKVQNASDFASVLAKKFDLLAADGEGSAKKAYVTTASALKKLNPTNADLGIYEALSEYYENKEINNTALRQAHQKAARALEQRH